MRIFVSSNVSEQSKVRKAIYLGDFQTDAYPV